MSDITLRLDKGTPLTNQEVDDNFDNLNADKYESGDSPLFVDIDADTIQLLGGTGTQGTLSWNADEETVDLIQNGATLQLGQEVQIHCRNATGSTIANGVAVYAAGTIGNSGRITIAPMIANGTIPAKYVLGITTEEIPNGEDGKVTTFGKVRELDTTAYSDGDVLYISPTTAGALTATEPTAPNISLPVAFVIHAHANGSLFTRVTPFDENAYATAAQGSTADSALQNVSEDTTPQLGGNLDTNGNDIAFGDNDKATFGASSDLQIYHDGTNSYIDDTSAGNLVLRGNPAVSIQKYTGEVSGVFNADGPVNLYYDNALKLATTSTGVNVTGTVTADGLTVDGSTLHVDATNNRVGFGTTIPNDTVQINGALSVTADNTAYTNEYFAKLKSEYGAIALALETRAGDVIQASNFGQELTLLTGPNSTGTVERLKIASNGDVSFYEDTGTTAKFYWDANAESLGIGTTSVVSSTNLTTQAKGTTGLGGMAMKDEAGANTSYVFVGGSAHPVPAYRGHLNLYAENELKLYTNASPNAKLVVDSSGNVGIGTSSPSTALDVNGTVTADGLTVNGAGSIVALSDNAVFNVNVSGGASKTSTINQRAKSSNGANAETSIVVTGSTGEAVSSWDFKLDTANGALTKAMSIDGSGDISFYEDTGTTAKFFWDASAESLGIGTTSPSTELEITGTSAAETGITTTHTRSGVGYTLILDNLNNGANQGSGVKWRSGGFDTGAIITRSDSIAASNDAPAYMTFHTSDNGTENLKERMRISSTGNVGIGTSSPACGLDVSNSGNGSVGEQVRITSTDAEAKLAFVTATGNGAISQIGYEMRFMTNTANVERMRIDSSGNLLVGTTSNAIGNTGFKINPVGFARIERSGTASQGHLSFTNGNGDVGSIATSASTTSYNTSSDERLKDNITDANDAGDKIDAIQVRQYDWKADGSHQDYGMIAQELMTVAPEAVSGDPESDEMMGVDYSKLVPMLIKEVQSLRARVAQLETGV